MSSKALLENNEVYWRSRRADQNDASKELRGSAETLVITCMDPRIHPEKFLGLEFGRQNAMIQRNGGGIASTALRDIVTGNVLVGIKEIMVIHHTDCGALQTHSGGLAKFIEEKIKEQGTWKEGALEAAKNLQAMAGFPRSEGQDDETVLINSVKSDLRFLNDHPFVRTDVHVSGYIYEMETGKLRQIYLE